MENNTIPATTNCYSDHIIVFLDVLGFSDATKKSAFDERIYAKINKLLEELKETVDTRTKDFHVRICSFSDSIYISCPTVSEQSFNEVCWIISEFCFKTISYGFFVRGALTVGHCQEKAGIMFGPACVRACELEHSLALWPRCIIDPTSLTRSDIYPDNSWEERNHYVLIGNDGLPYLDYLGYAFVSYFMRSLLKSKRSIPEALEDLALAPKIVCIALEEHKNAIYQAVQEARQNSEKTTLLLTKYYPLALYHNLAIRRFSHNENDPTYIKKLLEYYEYITGEKITKIKIQKILPSMTKYRDKWQEQLIDLKNLFSGFYVANT
ncbi:MAG: hypothetical protein FJ025_00050 [Chloroflexi bacterium]|nr:hypothetical protein [Chloroflexota bacterium]